jgi:hypothetical protein
MSHVDGVDGGVGYGVRGRSSRIGGEGVVGRSDSFIGVGGYSPSHYGVYGESDTSYGVYGKSSSGHGVYGESSSGYGVYGKGSGIGLYGLSYSGFGVCGQSNSHYGVFGLSYSGDGVCGESSSSYGVLGESSSGGAGVRGKSSSGHGVYDESDSGYGVYGYSSGSGYAAYLQGRVRVTGYLFKDGGGFEIDHPLDPANKYLYHSFVESPDMKNVYDGVVTLDDKGEAEIELPDWFSALNKDFRYQLTAIGAPGPNLYIAEEISEGVLSYSNNSNSSSNNKNNNNSRFKVAGGTSGMKVSWQVTGIRKGPWANAHRIQVEEDKSAKERGYYIYPDLYGKAAEKGISRLLFPTEEEEEERKKQEQLINNKDKRPKRKIPF